jgi:hypothetical protein
MAQRIDVELTSTSPDGTWTWRAAGARQPKGVVGADVVPAGSEVGTVLRAEVERTIDGVSVVSLTTIPTKTAQRATETIELLGPARRGPDVNVIYAPKGRGRRSERDDDRGPRRDRVPTRRQGGEAAGGRADGRRAGPTRPGADRRDTPRQQRREGGRGPATSTAYRNAALAALPPEQLPVAEALLRGGIPAVRQAIEEQNARARADGRAEVAPEPLLAMAEQLLPAVNLAVWKDRAAAASAAGTGVTLRELRSIVTAASTVTLDEEGRTFLAALRTSLDQRVVALREAWTARITTALDEGRVTDALHTSARAPEHGTRLAADLAVRLADAAGAAMSAETDPVTWSAVLAAVVDAPVRRSVKPAGLPHGADEELLAAARRAAGYVPELARLLGIPIPPPPGPRRPPARRTGTAAGRAAG